MIRGYYCHYDKNGWPQKYMQLLLDALLAKRERDEDGT